MHEHHGRADEVEEDRKHEGATGIRDEAGLHGREADGESAIAAAIELVGDAAPTLGDPAAVLQRGRDRDEAEPRVVRPRGDAAVFAHGHSQHVEAEGAGAEEAEAIGPDDLEHRDAVHGHRGVCTFRARERERAGRADEEPGRSRRQATRSDSAGRRYEDRSEFRATTRAAAIDVVRMVPPVAKRK